MSVPPEMMQPPPDAGGGSPGDAPPPPASAGIMTPQAPNGKIEGAKVKIMMVTKVLAETLASLEPGSVEFKAVMGAIKALEKQFGQEEDQNKELMPAEIKQMMQSLAGPGQAGAAPPGAGAPPPPQ